MDCCGKTFSRTFTYQRHLNSDQHRKAIGRSLDREFVCGTCNTGFTRNDDRDRHVLNGSCNVGRLGANKSVVPTKRKHGIITCEESAAIVHDLSEAETPTNVVPDIPSSTVVTPLRSMISCRSVNMKSRESGYLDFKVKVSDGYESAQVGQNFYWNDKDFDAVLESMTFDVSALIDTEITQVINGEAPPDTDIGDLNHEYNLLPITDYGKSIEEDSYLRTRSPIEYGGPIGDFSEQGHRSLITDLRSKPVVTRRPKLNNLRNKCFTCMQPFERNPIDLREHLNKHLQEWQMQYRCEECCLSFTRAQDLRHHLQCASNGACGFNFPHLDTCYGHHPPHRYDIRQWNDHDRLKVALLNWEHAQLQAMTAAAFPKTDSLKLRITAGNGRPSECSFLKRSTMGSLSVKSFRSLPYNVEARSTTQIEELEESVADMHLFGHPRAHSGSLIEALSSEKKHGSLCQSVYASIAADAIAMRSVRYAGFFDFVEDLVAKNEHPVFPDIDKTLIIAAASGRADLVNILLESDLPPNVNIIDEHGLTALHHAVRQRPNEVVRTPFNAQAVFDEQESEGLNTILSVARHDRGVIVCALLKAKALVDTQDFEGMTALHYAARHDRSEVVRALLEAQASIDTQDFEGMTPLHHAISFRNLASVRMLVTTAPSANNIVDKYGECVVYKSAKAGHIDILRVLLGAGFTMDNALTLATKRDEREVIDRLLLFVLFPPLQLVTDRETAFKAAGACGSTDILDFLLLACSHTCAANCHHSDAALQGAATAGRHETAEIAIGYGADVNAPRYVLRESLLLTNLVLCDKSTLNPDDKRNLTYHKKCTKLLLSHGATLKATEVMRLVDSPKLAALLRSIMTEL